MSLRSALNWFLIVCALFCVGLIGLSFETLRIGLDQIVEDGTAEFFSREVHLRFRIIAGIYGLIFSGTALVRFRCAALSQCSPVETTKSPTKSFGIHKFSRSFWAAVFLCSLLATVVRVVYLTQPMRYDEAYTYNTYISRGILAAVSTYESPNNHLLNTFFSWGAVKTFGNSPPSLRLPALLAGILCVGAVMMLAFRIAGIRAAFLAGILVALSSPLIEYSTNARGYTLLSLFTIVAWWSTVELIRHDRSTARWILAFSIGLGIATIPLMLLPLLMLGTWIGCLIWKSRDRTTVMRRILPSLLGGGLIAFVAYSPILTVIGPAEFLKSASGQNLSTRSFTGKLSESIEQATELLFRDIPWPVLILLALGVSAFVWRLTPLFRFGRVTAMISTITCSFPLILLNSSPPARVWLFLLPLLFVVWSCGTAGILESLKSRGIRNGATFAVVAIMGLWPFLNMTDRNSIRNSTETGAFPDAELILNDLHVLLKPSDQIYAIGPSHPQLVYYAERLGIDRHQFPNLSEDSIESGSFLICPNESVASIDELLGKLSPGLSREKMTLLKEYSHSNVFRIHTAQ